jgi:hypothetical protein
MPIRREASEFGLCQHHPKRQKGHGHQDEGHWDAQDGATPQPIEARDHERGGQPPGQDQRDAGDDGHHAERDDKRVHAEPRGQDTIDPTDCTGNNAGEHRREPDIQATDVKQRDQHTGQSGDGGDGKV